MSEKEMKSVEAETGTQSFYLYAYGELPKQDIAEEDLPLLLAALDMLDAQQAFVVKKTFGIGCEKLEREQIDAELGANRVRVALLEMAKLSIVESRGFNFEAIIKPLFCPRVSLYDQIKDLSGENQMLNKLKRHNALQMGAATALLSNIKNLLDECCFIRQDSECLDVHVGIDKLGFPEDICQALHEAGFDNLHDLWECSLEELSSRTLDAFAIYSVRTALSDLGRYYQR